MVRRKHVTVADHERLFFTRWVLLLLVANEAAGLPEVSRQRLHSLLFMSFASSRYYGIDPLRQRARRTPQGPYYRLAHVALGGLVLGGLVSIRGYLPHPARRQLQFEGLFRPTIAGMDVARKLRETLTGSQLYRLLLDMCLAAARTAGEAENDPAASVLDRVLEADLTYQRAVRRPGEILELQDVAGEPTPTIRGLNHIEDRLGHYGAFNRKDVVAAYQILLNRRSARVA